MTPDELDAIRARHRNLEDYGPINAAVDDVGALLVEVDRLRRELDGIGCSRFTCADDLSRANRRAEVAEQRLAAVRVLIGPHEVFPDWPKYPHRHRVTIQRDGFSVTQTMVDERALRAALGEA